MFGKRGVSAIIATVLIIMISIAAVAIIWAFIIPTVKDNLKDSTSEKVKLSIETDGGYTTWDEVQKVARVQVKRGNDNATLIGMDFSFVRGGSSVNRNRTDFPARNEIKIYEFELSELSGKPEKVLIAPITDKGIGSVVFQSSTLGSYTGKPMCTNFTYYAWSICSGGKQNRTVNTSEPTGCIGGSPVLINNSCMFPLVLIVSDATDEDFNKIYSYNTNSLKWENGSYLIYKKDNLWYLTNGTINYTAIDNYKNVPPSVFNRTLDYIHVIIVSGAGNFSFNGKYFILYPSPDVRTWIKEEDTSIRLASSTNSGGWFWSISDYDPHYFAYKTATSPSLVYPPSKTEWMIDESGPLPAPTIEYSFEANATVSYS